jgi:hypothetical protein
MLAKTIRQYNRKSDILEKYKEKHPEFYTECVELLMNEELIFDVDKSQIECFEILSDTFDYPFAIENITILLTNENKEDVKFFFEKGLHAITKNIGIFVTDNVSMSSLQDIIEMIFSNSILVGLYIVLNEKGQNFEQQLIDMKKGLVRVLCIQESITNNYFETIFYKNKWVKLSPCLSLYTEQKRFHSYFNRKLFIGSDGEIKNAPECSGIYGYLKDISDKSILTQIITSAGFQQYWHITKEKMSICKDCELREMCIDNREPTIKYENDTWGCSSHCSYNPYIAKWQGEDGYIPVEKCGKYSKATGFIPDHDKITELNKTIWDDE